MGRLGNYCPVIASGNTVSANDITDSTITNAKLKSWYITGSAVGTAGGTFAHTLGTTPVAIVITPKNLTAASNGVYVSSADSNNIVLVAGADSSTVDVWAIAVS